MSQTLWESRKIKRRADEATPLLWMGASGKGVEGPAALGFPDGQSRHEKGAARLDAPLVDLVIRQVRNAAAAFLVSSQ
jgi:hypothetical protein